MSAKPGRNDFCPCGSGKKYKNCCESGVSGLRNKRLSQLLLGVLLIVGLAAVSTAYVNVSGENVKTSDLARPSVNVTPSSDHPPVENVKLIP